MFDEMFPAQCAETVMRWTPTWSNQTDPSGRYLIEDRSLTGNQTDIISGPLPLMPPLTTERSRIFLEDISRPDVPNFDFCFSQYMSYLRKLKYTKFFSYLFLFICILCSAIWSLRFAERGHACTLF